MWAALKESDAYQWRRVPSIYTVVMSTDSDTAVSAGTFGEWLASMRGVLRGDHDADVPCGNCVGCCVSSYPILLRLRDKLARDQVPQERLIGPARCGERWLMGYRDDGSCPFLLEHRCSIYTDRPQTCRDYDCRIYAAAGIMPDGNRPAIAERVKAWQFIYCSSQERREADAVARAAQFIRANQALFPPGMRAGSATAAAVLAIKTFPMFLSADESRSPEELAQRVIDAARIFDEGIAPDRS
jgi:Fe-S-cluster containining protein